MKLQFLIEVEDIEGGLSVDITDPADVLGAQGARHICDAVMQALLARAEGGSPEDKEVESVCVGTETLRPASH